MGEPSALRPRRASSSADAGLEAITHLSLPLTLLRLLAPVSERCQSVPLENARIAAAGSTVRDVHKRTCTSIRAEGAFATVYVGTLMSQ